MPAGISFGKDDMVIPEAKEELVERGPRTRCASIEQQYMDGLITQGEKYNKVVDIWSQCTDKVADALMMTSMEEIDETIRARRQAS